MIRSGEAVPALVPILYEHLHALARRWFKVQPPDHTLQPTALVHEAYLRLIDRPEVACRSRTHFLALASKAMRQVLVDHTRRRRAEKRGGRGHRVTLAEAACERAGLEVDVSALEEALDRLEQLHARQCRIVELRYLAGLTVEETAEVLDVSCRTVKLDWRMARAWLHRELT